MSCREGECEEVFMTERSGELSCHTGPRFYSDRGTKVYLANSHSCIYSTRVCRMGCCCVLHLISRDGNLTAIFRFTAY